jgi:hypothetical protein
MSISIPTQKTYGNGIFSQQAIRSIPGFPIPINTNENNSLTFPNRLIILTNNEFFIFLSNNQIGLIFVIDSFLPKEINKDNIRYLPFDGELLKCVADPTEKGIIALYSNAVGTYIIGKTLSRIFHSQNGFDLYIELKGILFIDFHYLNNQAFLLINKDRSFLIIDGPSIKDIFKKRKCDLSLVTKDKRIIFIINNGKKILTTYKLSSNITIENENKVDLSTIEGQIKIAQLIEDDSYLLMLTDKAILYLYTINKVNYTVELKGSVNKQLESFSNEKNVIILYNQKLKLLYVFDKERILCEMLQIDISNNNSQFQNINMIDIKKLNGVNLFKGITGAAVNNDKDNCNKIYLFTDKAELYELKHNNNNDTKKEEQVVNAKKFSDEMVEEIEEENEDSESAINSLVNEYKKFKNEIEKLVNEHVQTNIQKCNLLSQDVENKIKKQSENLNKELEKIQQRHKQITNNAQVIDNNISSSKLNALQNGWEYHMDYYTTNLQKFKSINTKIQEKIKENDNNDAIPCYSNEQMKLLLGECLNNDKFINYLGEIEMKLENIIKLISIKNENENQLAEFKKVLYELIMKYKKQFYQLEKFQKYGDNSNQFKQFTSILTSILNDFLLVINSKFDSLNKNITSIVQKINNFKSKNSNNKQQKKLPNQVIKQKEINENIKFLLEMHKPRQTKYENTNCIDIQNLF